MSPAARRARQYDHRWPDSMAHDDPGTGYPTRGTKIGLTVCGALLAALLGTAWQMPAFAGAGPADGSGGGARVATR